MKLHHYVFIAIFAMCAVHGVLRADEFVPKRTVQLDVESLSIRAKFFRVGTRYVVVDKVGQGGRQTEVSVFGKDGVLLERMTWNLELRNVRLHSDNALYIAGYWGRFVRFGLADSVRWMHIMSDPIYHMYYSQIEIGKDQVYFAGEGKIIALSQLDGSEVWIRNLPADASGISGIFYRNGKLHIVSQSAKNGDKCQAFQIFDGANGEPLSSECYSKGETKPFAYVTSQDFIYGTIRMGDAISRVVKMNWDGKILYDVSTFSICKTQRGLWVIPIGDRVYAACSAGYPVFETELFELDSSGKTSKRLGAVPTFMAWGWSLGGNILFWGGSYDQDYGISKFAFSDGQALSPIKTILGDRKEYPLQVFDFDDKRQSEELAVLTTDQSTGKIVVLIFDAV